MDRRVPLWLKVAFTAFVIVWVPVYWPELGPENFLWFCDLANFLILFALWTESPLLFSSQAVSTLLVQIFFWSALAIALPALTAEDVGEYWFKASAKGFAFAWVFWNGGFWPWLAFVVAGIIVGRYVSRWRHRVQEETGRLTYPGTFWLGTVLLFAIVGWFAWPLLAFVEPVFHWIADLVASLPPILVPIVIAVAAVLAAISITLENSMMTIQVSHKRASPTLRNRPAAWGPVV